MNKYVLKTIAITEFLLGIALLLQEIVDYIHLSSTHTIECQFNGLVDFVKYQESCYKNLFLYLLMVFTGLSFWINKKIYWVLTQILLITLVFILTWNLWIISSYYWLVSLFVESFLLFLFLYLEKKIGNTIFLKKIGITKTIKYVCILGCGLSCIIWFLLSLI
jgi:hypothetical protein